LDLELPSGVEWRSFLAGKGVAVLTDEVGRLAVSVPDAKRLIAEQRDLEASQREQRARSELQAVERDRLWRAQLPTGVPASLIPAGMSIAEAFQQAELDSLRYAPKRTTLIEDVCPAMAGLTIL
jgi:hypothetical protein